MAKKAVSSKKSKILPQNGYVGVLLEDINEKLDLVMGEVVGDNSKLSKMEVKLDKLANDMEVVKTDLELMKGGLKLKVDLDDFQALERRVSRLESRS